MIVSNNFANSRLRGFGRSNFGTASQIDGRECTPSGSWETYCACMFPAGSPNFKACSSTWPFAPWTMAGKFTATVGGAPAIVETAAPLVRPAAPPAAAGTTQAPGVVIDQRTGQQIDLRTGLPITAVGMSTNIKIAIGVGVTAVLGGVLFMLARR